MVIYSIEEASDLLKVNKETLRRWDRSGKLKASRNPVNGHRYYTSSQLDSDEDGVNDSVDECNSTPSGEEVNAQGCSNSEKLYLAENGVTVKCRGCDVNGEILELNGERYVSFTNDYDFRRYYSEHNSTSLKMVTTNLRSMENFFIRSGRYNNAIDISHWDTSNVIDMENIFSSDLGPYNDENYYAIIDADISNWDTSNVTNMARAFYNTIFTGDISNWDVSSVENMREMFAVDFVFATLEPEGYSKHPFNGDISNWDVSSVENMHKMYWNSSFNQDIGGWNVSSVETMFQMFDNSNFNQDISNWDVINVTSMRHMFRNSPFNQNISSWDMSTIEVRGMLSSVHLIKIFQVGI